ncbi:hypothetical protein MM182_00225 [Aeromonas sp. MR19]|uniref:hypothetical protein n=1 Tax=Aeromonas sp. MR19 TaxID=2923421 RepID=UPI001F4A89DA|nr:hypothetical protein [Aeromonas sp. MR19]MCH7373821.1 hypothetical protein [Aeromonas sp. MR19]
MRIEDVENFFGNAAKACEAIGIDRCNFSKWKKQNKGIVPANHAVSFVIASHGELRLGLEDYPLDKELQLPTQQAA